MIKFGFLEIEEIFLEWFSLPTWRDTHREELERLGFNKTIILVDSGIFIPIIFMSIMPVIVSFFLSYPEKKCHIFARCRVIIDDIFKWNFTMRLLFEISLDIAILAMIEIYTFNLQSWASFSLAILLYASLVGLSLFIIFYVRRVNLNSRNVSKRIGTTYDGLILKKSSLVQPIWFLYRRLAFAACAFYGVGYIFIQFLFLFNSSFFTFGIISRRIYDL